MVDFLFPETPGLDAGRWVFNAVFLFLPLKESDFLGHRFPRERLLTTDLLFSFIRIAFRKVLLRLFSLIMQVLSNTGCRFFLFSRKVLLSYTHQALPEGLELWKAPL